MRPGVVAKGLLSFGETRVTTTAEQLAEVQAAISAILTKGQSFTINGRRLDRADLDALYKREGMLERKLAREARGGMRVRQAVPVD